MTCNVKIFPEISKLSFHFRMTWFVMMPSRHLMLRWYTTLECCVEISGLGCWQTSKYTDENTWTFESLFNECIENTYLPSKWSVIGIVLSNSCN